jgi:hypothetical protein
MFSFNQILFSGIFFLLSLLILIYSLYGLKKGAIRGHWITYPANYKIKWFRFKGAPLVYKDKDPKTFKKILLFYALYIIITFLLGIIVIVYGHLIT